MALSDQIHSLVKCAVLVAVPVGIFIFVTSYETVSISKKDRAMRTAIGETNSFTVFPDQRTPDKLKGGQIIAFTPEGGSEAMKVRVAWVIAVEGQTVSVKRGKRGPQLCVDGRPFGHPKKIDTRITIPDFVVPRGHVYVLFDDSTQEGDSFEHGPLPWRRIIGRAKVKIK
jgi:hypothetical protein